MPSTAKPRLTDVERELIAFFVSAAQAFGVPRSVGEIYGLYFACERPMPMDEVVGRLRISKGSASQGIRFLRSINALRSTYVPGDRRDHFEPELSLRVIAEGFVNERIRPQLRDGNDRLRSIRERYDADQLAPVDERLTNIESWNRKAEFLVPFVHKFLGKKEKPKPQTSRQKAAPNR